MRALFASCLFFLQAFVGVSVCCIGMSAYCGDLTSPFSLDSAAVLPKGVRSARITTLSTTIDNTYNNDGRLEGVGSSMNKAVTYNDLVKAFSNTEERAKMRGFVLSTNRSLDGVVGQSEGIVNSQITAMLPVMAYGITEKLTFAVAVPVVHSSVNVSAGWTSNPEMDEALKALSSDGKHNMVLQNAPKLQNVVYTQLAAKGYQIPRDQDKTQLGDISLVAKYQLLNEGHWLLALQPRIVLPTGRPAATDDIVDIGGGDGQWDLGLASSAEYVLNGRVSLVGTVGYLWQIPDHQVQRIPEAANETLTPDTDWDTRRDLGDIWSSTLGLRYKLNDAWSLGTAGGFQYKNADVYEGGRYSAVRYSWMSKDTEQTMATAQAGVTYSTAAMYREKRFAVPLESSFTMSSVLDGRNVRQNNIAAVEMVVYF